MTLSSTKIIVCLKQTAAMFNVFAALNTIMIFVNLETHSQDFRKLSSISWFSSYNESKVHPASVTSSQASLSLSRSTISTEINCTSFPNRAISQPSVHQHKSGLVDVNLLRPQTPPSEDWIRPNPQSPLPSKSSLHINSSMQIETGVYAKYAKHKTQALLLCMLMMSKKINRFSFTACWQIGSKVIYFLNFKYPDKNTYIFLFAELLATF